jgi:hypothetical protein
MLTPPEMNGVADCLEPQCADGSHWTRLHVRVQHVQFSKQHLANRSFVRQPSGTVAGGEAEAFGGAVIFVNDWAPPVDYLLFDLDRTGRRRMDCDLERGQV